jgi:type IV pilus assembly protein PilQ
VDSGSTLVIGGIYTMQNSHSGQGIPWLRKVPVLGWLFGSDTNVTQRSELYIFVTPRILNPREAGLTS